LVRLIEILIINKTVIFVLLFFSMYSVETEFERSVVFNVIGEGKIYHYVNYNLYILDANVIFNITKSFLMISFLQVSNQSSSISVLEF